MERVILTDRKGFTTTVFIESGIYSVNVAEMPKIPLAERFANKNIPMEMSHSFVEFRWFGMWSNEWNGVRVRIFEEC